MPPCAMKALGYWPLALVLAAATILADLTSLDRDVAALFFDTDAGRFPARHAFWAESLLHRGGIWLIAGIAVMALVMLLGSTRSVRLRSLRRATLYLLACIALTTGGVALLKRITNVDCPWDMQAYGGELPYVHVFGDKPERLERGTCFPGAHSSGAFSLMAVAVLLARQRRRHADLALWAALGLGFVYAGCQWARGAHLPSHDLASALVAWTVAHGLARLMLPRQAKDPGITSTIRA